jgi:orotate phosphoribosyltransferase
MKMKIARSLIEKGCVKLSPKDPFTYASGLKGPIYCDNRLILSHVDLREIVINSFSDFIQSRTLHFDLIGGIATAGIPYAAFIADRLKMPMVYVRPKAKEHGKKNQIEGDFHPNQTVLLIEDLVNQGSSLADAMAGLTEAKLLSSHCLCIVDYKMAEAQKRLKELSLSLFSLTDFDHIVAASLKLKLIDEEGKNLLMDWHENPKEWSKLL